MKKTFFPYLSDFPLKHFSVLFFTGLIILILAYPPFNLFPAVKTFFSFKHNKTSVPKNVLKIDNEIKQTENIIKSIKPENNVNKTGKTTHIRTKKPASLKFLHLNCMKFSNGKCIRKTLDNFYKKLLNSTHEKITVSYFGDSLTSHDKVISTLRNKLQSQFGYAGAGYIPSAKAWEWISNHLISLSFKGWKIYSPITKTLKDKIYGFGGVTVKTIGPGAHSVYACKHCKKPISEVTVSYVTHPSGGKFFIKTNDKIIKTVVTSDKIKSLKFIKIKNLLTRKVIVESLSGYVRLAGVFLESSDTSGVTVDGITMIGGRFIHLSGIDRKTWLKAAVYRKPDLMIFQFGANESDTGIDNDYKDKVLNFLHDIHENLPETDCLIIGSTDKVTKKSGEYKTKPIIRRIIRLQKEIARKGSCAFLDIREAMGGEASAYAWYKHSPKLMAGDLTHFTLEGAKKAGGIIYLSLIKGLLLYKYGH